MTFLMIPHHGVMLDSQETKKYTKKKNNSRSDRIYQIEPIGQDVIFCRDVQI